MKPTKWALALGLLPAAAVCAEITVTGVGTVKAVPNQGKLSVTCSTVGNASQTLDQVRKLNEACERSFAAEAHAVAGKSNVDVVPSFEKRYEYKNVDGVSKRVYMGWQVVTRFDATLPRSNGQVLAADLAKLYDAADRAKAETGTPVLGFTPETRKTLRNQALGLATEDAEAVARAAIPKGHELGELQALSTTGVVHRSVPSPMMAAAPRSARMESAGPTVVEIAEQEITHTIEAIYKFGKKLLD